MREPTRRWRSWDEVEAAGHKMQKEKEDKLEEAPKLKETTRGSVHPVASSHVHQSLPPTATLVWSGLTQGCVAGRSEAKHCSWGEES